MSVIPIIVSKHGPTWKIGHFINDILQPFVTKILQPTLFRDEVDLIRKLNQYTQKEHRLRPTTLFCSLKITNFYTLDVHSDMIDFVHHFLTKNLCLNKLGNVTILTIKNLLHLYLHNNVFSYGEQIYQFTKGAPSTMALSETLANIYLFVWQKKIQKVNERNELFGR